MSHVLLGVVLFAVYAGASWLGTAPASDRGTAEARQLLIAESLVSDSDLDVTDEYATRAYSEFHPGVLAPDGRMVGGRRLEPSAPGFAALIAPAYAAAGARGAMLLCAALAALAFVVARALARVAVPEPWATWGILLVSLSAPAVAHATTVDPVWGVAGLLGAAILLTIRAREDPRLPVVAGAALALALTPWLDATMALAGLPVAAVLLRWTLRGHRRLAALIAAEILSTSLIAYVMLSEVLYGGPTPLAAAAPGAGLASAAGLVDRLPGLASAWLDRDLGALRWAPVLVLAFYGAWRVWRSRRGHLSRILPAHRDAEAVCLLAASAGAVVWLGPALLGGPDPADRLPGTWLVGALPLAGVLVAWSLRRLPRLGVALGALTLAATVGLSIELASGALDGWRASAGSRIPWGPLEALWPSWDEASP